MGSPPTWTMTRSVQQAYSLLVEQYVSLFGSVAHVHPGDLGLIGRHLAQASGPVLDLGCGPGHLTGFLRSVGADVTGIDLVPEFIAHARATHPGLRFEVGSMVDVDRPAGSVAGVLAWFSLIHLDPGQVDGVLATIRRVMAPGGAFVLGFFDGAEVEPFDHKVVTAYRWPVDEMARRLVLAGFVEVERLHRAQEGERRPYSAIVARAA
jgi:SAM-dependent methyltransferase